MKKTVLAVGLLCHAFSVANAAGQTCPSAMIKNAPDDRYSVSDSSPIVFDKQTNLSWMRCSTGQTWDGTTSDCTGTITTMNWQAALQSATDANSSSDSSVNYDYNDWRLPNIKELTSLVEYACYSPSINNTMFPSTAKYSYWSSSASASSSSYAWVVLFDYGYGYNGLRNSVKRVRLVRRGQ